jgi:hypothetical protein
MRLDQLHAVIGAATILFTALCAAKHGHSHQLEHLARKRHNHLHVERTQDPVEKRGGACAFPTNAGLVPVTPNEQNGGWAMSPDQQCLPGSYCPFACPSGQVMAQWNPAATAYIYPLSMVGHRLCFFFTSLYVLTSAGWWIVLQSQWPDHQAFPQQTLLC